MGVRLRTAHLPSVSQLSTQTCMVATCAASPNQLCAVRHGRATTGTEMRHCAAIVHSSHESQAAVRQAMVAQE
jgi:hypothetical protein